MIIRTVLKLGKIDYNKNGVSKLALRGIIVEKTYLVDSIWIAP